jgi:hypothetical protein
VPSTREYSTTGYWRTHCVGETNKYQLVVSLLLLICISTSRYSVHMYTRGHTVGNLVKSPTGATLDVTFGVVNCQFDIFEEVEQDRTGKDGEGKSTKLSYIPYTVIRQTGNLEPSQIHRSHLWRRHQTLNPTRTEA